MTRPKNASNKRRYDKYKAEGRLGINKKKKQERHEKRLQKFAEKKAAGKGYEYSKEHTQAKLESIKNYPYSNCDISVVNQYDFINSKWKDGGCKTEYAKLASIFTKLNNELNKARNEAKKFVKNIEKDNYKKKRRIEDESRN